MIDQLLEQRQVLHSIAVELYGEEYILNKKFWHSPTEKDMRKVFQKLELYGYEDPQPTDEEQQEADQIMEQLKNKGIL